MLTFKGNLVQLQLKNFKMNPHQIEKHSFDGEGGVVLRGWQAVAQLDELHDLVERAATKRRYDEINRLKKKSFNLLHLNGK